MASHRDQKFVERRRLPREGQVVYDIDVKDILRTFLRRKWLMLCVFAAVVACGLFWGMSQPKIYSTQTIVQMNNRDARILNKIDAVVGDVERENIIVQTEVDLMRSPYLISRVVDRLNLTAEPEFNPTLGSDVDDAYARNVTIRNVLDIVRVSGTPRSLSIVIRVRSHSPEWAVQIADAVAEEYLADQVEAKTDMTVQAGKFLEGRLEELRVKLTQSEEKVRAYREAHNLFETQGRTVTDQQLSELNTQLILARANRAEKEALLRQVNQLKRRGGIDSVSQVLNSHVIQSLKVQESEVARRQADMASRYGPKHPRMTHIQAEMADLQGKIAQEVSRVILGIENDVSIARSRELELERGLNQVKQKVSEGEAYSVELAELEREMNANRAVYEAFLSRSKEAAQQKNVVQTDARIISRAVKPIRPASPRVKVILLLSVFFGLCCAIAIVTILEHLDDSFRTLTQVEKQTGYVGIGLLPLLNKGINIVTYLKDKPMSLYAENLRKMMSSAMFSHAETPPKVMMVTSAVMGEGKSTFALGLACVAAQSGQKVLLIDADMRRPVIAEAMNLNLDYNLNDILQGKTSFDKAVVHDEETKVDFVCAQGRTPNSNELLSGERMLGLVRRARKSYDLVIMDTPPVSALVDTTTVARQADTTLFVIEWGKTLKGSTQHAMTHMQQQKLPVAGVVLNGVDMKKAKHYGIASNHEHYAGDYDG